jgi:hypothetical protein
MSTSLFLLTKHLLREGPQLVLNKVGRCLVWSTQKFQTMHFLTISRNCYADADDIRGKSVITHAQTIAGNIINVPPHESARLPRWY